MSLKIGDKVPAFSMFDSQKKEFNNDTINGKKALFLFVPAAFTSVCTKEFCGVRDDIAYYNNLNAVVVGISTDSLFTLARWKEEQAMNFILASDYNKEVTAAFGVAYDVFAFGMRGTSKRSAFVINEQGVVTYAEVLDNASEVPDFEKIKAALEL
ncbi:MAG: redoxin domain-containing protein [Bacteroidetes bacterium]|nr:redoxin domain-containing protein [Bacteroidota bacterium]